MTTSITLDIMPDDALIYIFNKVTSPGDLFNLSRSCKRFKEVIFNTNCIWAPHLVSLKKRVSLLLNPPLDQPSTVLKMRAMHEYIDPKFYRLLKLLEQSFGNEVLHFFDIDASKVLDIDKPLARTCLRKLNDLDLSDLIIKLIKTKNTALLCSLIMFRPRMDLKKICEKAPLSSMRSSVYSYEIALIFQFLIKSKTDLSQLPSSQKQALFWSIFDLYIKEIITFSDIDACGLKLSKEDQIKLITIFFIKASKAYHHGDGSFCRVNAMTSLVLKDDHKNSLTSPFLRDDGITEEEFLQIFKDLLDHIDLDLNEIVLPIPGKTFQNFLDNLEPRQLATIAQEFLAKYKK